jgi:hypothetical protein
LLFSVRLRNWWGTAWFVEHALVVARTCFVPNMADVDAQIRMIASFVELEATEKAAEIRAR